MKTITKTLVFIAFIAISFSSNAQIKFAAKTGINISTLRIGDSDNDETINSKIGFTLGAIVEYSIADNMAFQSGLMWTQKGAKTKQSALGVSYKGKVSINYIEVPMNFVYKMDAFQIYGGPYLAFGAGGKIKNDVQAQGVVVEMEDDIKFGSGDDDHFKGTDFGLNIGAGYLFGNILVNAGYSLGLSNINPHDGIGNSKTKNGAITLGVSYFFGE